jgi:hypothetical protein
VPSEHREHPVLHYGEPVVLAVIILAGLFGLSYGAFAQRDRPVPVVHPPTVTNAPSQEGDVIEAEGVRRILPWWEVKTGEKALLKRHLPYEGAAPDQASYELYVGQ